MMKKTLLFTLALALTAMTLNAQSTTSNVAIRGDQKVSLLVERHVAFNERTLTIPGYRIQVASLSGTDSKHRANELRNRILSQYSDNEVYVIYEEPNFKVKIGDFTTRLEAYATLSKIKEAFPGAILRDMVNAIPQKATAPASNDSEF